MHALCRPVPDVVVREARRSTLAVVDFLMDVQGLDVTHIKCEFIQRYDKRLVLHDLYEVEFRDDVVFDHVLGTSLMRSRHMILRLEQMLHILHDARIHVTHKYHTNITQISHKYHTLGR